LDPLLRLQRYLQGKSLWSEAEEEKIKAEAEPVINQAVQEAEEFPAPKPEDMFEYTFAKLPPNLQEQMSDYLEFLKKKES
jgi:pyruvate dehydrogenase E1 component alpha subunit